jgi:pyruvate dehydrogenase (quinone)
MVAEKESIMVTATTADIVAESLLDWGVDTIFGLPGDGINGFIEALRRRKDKIRFVLVRHEESASFMACAYAKYTGKLGACVATSGPGAVHLLTGLYDAKADSTPVVAITGSTYSDMMGSHYQQDVDLLHLFSDFKARCQSPYYPHRHSGEAAER